MVDRAVFDTSSIEKIGSDEVVVSRQVADEVNSRGQGEGLIDSVKSASVESTSQCVNDNIQGDIESAARDIGLMQRKKVAEALQRAGEERSEQGRQTQLKKAYDKLPGSAQKKSWQGELAGAKTDCSVLKLGEQEGEVVTEDKRILEMCEEKEGVKCRSLR